MKAFRICFLLFIVFSLFSTAFAIHETNPAETQLVIKRSGRQIGRPHLQPDLMHPVGDPGFDHLPQEKQAQAPASFFRVNRHVDQLNLAVKHPEAYVS